MYEAETVESREVRHWGACDSCLGIIWSSYYRVLLLSGLAMLFPGARIYNAGRTQFPKSEDGAGSLHVASQDESSSDLLFAAFVSFQMSPNGSGRQHVLDAMWRCKALTSKDVNAVYEFL